MPDSMGKRQRRDVKAKKAAAVEERRLARAQRQRDRSAGLIESGAPIAAAEDDWVDPAPASAPSEPAQADDVAAGPQPADPA
jgi:type II secretory pathway pseudopilin PulG